MKTKELIRRLEKMPDDVDIYIPSCVRWGFVKDICVLYNKEANRIIIRSKKV